MKLVDGIPIWGTADEGAISQIKTCAKTADRVALMADNHKRYAVDPHHTFQPCARIRRNQALARYLAVSFGVSRGF